MRLAMRLHWVELGVRWARVIAGICWIGFLFCFIALEASLKAPAQPDPLR